MNEKLIQMIEALGADGLTAFYVYIINDSLQLFFLLGLVAWGARAVWPTLKKTIDD